MIDFHLTEINTNVFELTNRIDPYSFILSLTDKIEVDKKNWWLIDDFNSIKNILNKLGGKSFIKLFWVWSFKFWTASQILSSAKLKEIWERTL